MGEGYRQSLKNKLWGALDRARKELRKDLADEIEASVFLDLIENADEDILETQIGYVESKIEMPY